MTKVLLALPLALMLAGCTTTSSQPDANLCQKLQPLTVSDYARVLSYPNADDFPLPKRLYSPDYPRALLIKGISGKATVQYDVLADGTTANIKVVAKTHSKFGKSLEKAAACWTFEPIKEARSLQQSYEWFAR
ncbi:TonB family protein [Endozoicomonadaceae bacterium StTr2]